MSKAISVKIKDDIFNEIEEIVSKLNIPRNSYINLALKYFNQLNRRKFLKETFAEESMLVRENSLHILEEFEQFEESIRE
ncbi:MAG: hypothetical protein IIB45_03545 [Candidatus Marinimicrobia bacterium]|nr:hypothetical protein [Candidatus Neomarinimicrobiota bacterium]